MSNLSFYGSGILTGFLTTSAPQVTFLIHTVSKLELFLCCSQHPFSTGVASTAFGQLLIGIFRSGAAQNSLAKPESWTQQNSIIWRLIFWLLEQLQTTFTCFAFTFHTKALTLESGSEKVVPDLKEKAAIDRLANDRPRMVTVMLESSIEDWVVCIGIVQLVSPMQVAAIHVKEDGIFKKHEVDVNWDE